MFLPLRDSLADDIEVVEFAMKEPPLLFHVVEGVAAARQSSGADMDNDNEFDEVYSGRNHSGNKVGGEMSTNMEARLILRRFWSKKASLTSPSLFAKTTGDKGSYFSTSDEDDSYIPKEEPTAKGLYDDDELFQDDKEEDLEDLSYYRSDAKFGVGRKLNAGGPPKPDVSNMSNLEATMVLNNWKVDRKAYNDKVQRERRKSLGTMAQPSDIVEHSGVLTDRLRMMTEVQTSPLLVDHTFPDKELLLLRIGEEANLSGCRVSCKRSDDYRVQVYGSDTSSSFCVKAVFSISAGWKITTAETRDIALSQADSDNLEDVATEPDHGLEGVDENDDDHADGVVMGDADADGDADEVIMRSVAKGNCNRSPIKSRWIFPLIKEVISKAPNLSNREMKNILSDYIKVKFQKYLSSAECKDFC